MLKTIRDNIIRKVASRHVAGAEIVDALQVCRWASEKGFYSIVSPWAGMNENPRNMFERYRLNIATLGSENLNCYLSIKLDAIGYDFGLFKELLELGRLHNIRIHVDSLGPDSAPTKFRFLEKAVEFNKVLGCTLPSRWKRSVDDADRAVSLGLAVRIVKGQWEDPNNKVDCKKNYLAIAEKLAGRAHHVGVATHDLPLAEKALACLISFNTYCELEQFFSLPLNGRDLARKLCRPYRIYVAYGHPGVPYNVRFALTRPSIAAWMLADFALRLKRPWSNYDHHQLAFAM